MTDFDGSELSEKDLALKYGVRFHAHFPILSPGRRAESPARGQTGGDARAPDSTAARRFPRMSPATFGKAYESKSFQHFRQIAPELKLCLRRRGQQNAYSFFVNMICSAAVAAMVFRARVACCPKPSSGESLMRQLIPVAQRFALGAGAHLVGWGQGTFCRRQGSAAGRSPVHRRQDGGEGQVPDRTAEIAENGIPCRWRFRGRRADDAAGLASARPCQSEGTGVPRSTPAAARAAEALSMRTAVTTQHTGRRQRRALYNQKNGGCGADRA